jgi:hypothetical protein
LCACILHNLLIDEPCPIEWFDLPNGQELDENDELNLPVQDCNDSGTRWNQIFAYLLECEEEKI